MGILDDMARDLVTGGRSVVPNTDVMEGMRTIRGEAAPQLGGRPMLEGPARVPAQQVPLYSPPQLEGPGAARLESQGAARLLGSGAAPPTSSGGALSPVSRLAGPAGPSNLPAVNVPWYEPEQVPRLGAPSNAAGGSAGALPPPDGPISRAASMASRVGPLSMGAGVLAGGAAATAAAGGAVAADPEYFKSSIGDDGLAANIISAAQPSRIADVAQQPTTARSQNGPTNVPLIGQVAAMDLGQRFPPMPQTQAQPDADPAYRQGYIRELQNQAYRESDPIGQIIAQKLGPQGAAQNAPVADGIVSGGDTVYSPGRPVQTSPYRTADGRTIDPNDANLSADDQAMISQHQAQTAQMLADMQRQQQANPMAGAVTIIRPDNDVSVAVQGRDRMVEMNPTAYAAYNQAFQKNPQLAQRAQITANGPVIDGNLVPADVIAGGDNALKSFVQATQQDAINKADPNAAAVRAKVAEAMGDPGLATGATSSDQAADRAQLHGDEFLKTLPQGRASIVQSLVNGDTKVTPQLLTKNPGILAHALQADPTFNQSRFDSVQAFKVGKDAATVKSINQAIGHAEETYKSINDLNNAGGWQRPLNSIVNPIQEALGDDSRQGVLKTNVQALASELRTAFSATGGNLKEVEDWKESFPMNASKKQQTDYLKAGLNLLHGVTDALQSKADTGTGLPGKIQVVNPKSQGILDEIYGKAHQGGAAAQPAGPPAATAPQQDLSSMEAELKRRGLIK